MKSARAESSEPEEHQATAKARAWPDAGPRLFYRAALASLAVTSLLAIAISAFVRPSGPLSWQQGVMIVIPLAALCLSVALGAVSLAMRGKSRPVPWLDRLVAPQTRSVIWLALAAWIPLLLVVVYFRARATFPQTVQWLYYGFEDKRWITTTYLLGAIAPMILLTAASRVLTVGRTHPLTFRAWLSGLFPRDSKDADTSAGPASDSTEKQVLSGSWRSRVSRSLPAVAGLATALGLGWYFLGPPWYVTRNTSLILPQEDEWFTGFQAIAHGAIPYTGPATSQYGPGTQVLTYWIMRHLTSFSVVGFRESWAIYQWVGATILFAIFFLAFGYARGLAISLLSVLVYPALHEVAFQPNGAFGGYFGWANPLRYAGMIALVVFLPVVVRRCPSRLGVTAAAALGLFWGVTSYLAQENLVAGAVGGLVILALLLFTGTAAWPAVRAAVVAVLAAFLLIWLPVLAFYTLHGDLGHFLHEYFLLSRAMPQGFGNNPWHGPGGIPFSYTTMFYVLPFLLALVALLMVFETRPGRIAAGWSQERVRLAVTVIIVTLLYQGVLLRSDTTDMTSTLLMVPAFVVMTATLLPRLLGARRPVTLTIAGASIAVASLLLLPWHDFAPNSVGTAAETPYLDRQRLAALPSPGMPGTVAAQRIGAGLDAAPQCCQGPLLTMPSLVSLMNRIHAIVGHRTAYVADIPHGYPGFVYFVADLTPPPVNDDKYLTILNEPQLTAYMTYFSTSVLPHTQALVSGSLTAPEARMFLKRYPNARRISLNFGLKPYYVLLARP